MRKSHTLPPAYFEGLYGAASDPWGFASSPYEHAKYEATLAALNDEAIEHALEVGCSIGVLTHRLASRCGRLTATEVSAKALDQARGRCIGQPNVRFQHVGSIDDRLPGPFDLILLSEVVYYWDDADLDRAAGMIRSQIRPGGRVLLVHWLGETDYPKSGDDAVESLRVLLADWIRVERASRTQDYRLDLWRWTSAAGD